MRWADLDQLNHVNNVLYIDYAEQARAELVASGEVAEARITRMETEFKRPLQLSRTPVLVRSHVEQHGTSHDIAPDGEDATYASVRLLTGPVKPVEQTGDHQAFDVAVRRSDRDAHGFVTATRFFEICQEARIYSFASLIAGRRPGHVVVARVDVTLGEPVGPDVTALSGATAITHVGRSSFSTTTWFDGGRYGAVTAVLVGFDPETQRSKPLSDKEREAFLSVLVTT